MLVTFGARVDVVVDHAVIVQALSQVRRSSGPSSKNHASLAASAPSALETEESVVEETALTMHTPSRKTLAEVPIRALKFLRIVGTRADVASVLRTAGYTLAEHEEGWDLLRQAGAASAKRATPETLSSPAAKAFDEIETTIGPYFRRARAALLHKYPEQEAFIFEKPSRDSRRWRRPCADDVPRTGERARGAWESVSDAHAARTRALRLPGCPRRPRPARPRFRAPIRSCLRPRRTALRMEAPRRCVRCKRMNHQSWTRPVASRATGPSSS